VSLRAEPKLAENAGRNRSGAEGRRIGRLGGAGKQDKREHGSEEPGKHG
jgi:hypothetical protein